MINLLISYDSSRVLKEHCDNDLFVNQGFLFTHMK